MATRTSRKSPVGQAEDIAKRIRNAVLSARDERDAAELPASSYIATAIELSKELAFLLRGIDARDSEIEKQFRERFGYQPKR
jgi:hypothetical protein